MVSGLQQVDQAAGDVLHVMHAQMMKSMLWVAVLVQQTKLDQPQVGADS